MSVKFLGTSDEVLQCECCGKKNLKSTVALSIDDGEAVYYGVTCAARTLKLQAKDVRAESNRVDREKAGAEAQARMARQEAEVKKWLTWLERNGTGADTFTRIQSLGGFAEARAMYKEQQ